MVALNYGIGFKSQRPMDEIENWLEENIQGYWDIRMVGMDDSDPLHIKKQLEVLFEREEDKLFFKANFGQIK